MVEVSEQEQEDKALEGLENFIKGLKELHNDFPKNLETNGASRNPRQKLQKHVAIVNTALAGIARPLISEISRLQGLTNLNRISNEIFALKSVTILLKLEQHRKEFCAALGFFLADVINVYRNLLSNHLYELIKNGERDELKKVILELTKEERYDVENIVVDNGLDNRSDKTWGKVFDVIYLIRKQLGELTPVEQAMLSKLRIGEIDDL